MDSDLEEGGSDKSLNVLTIPADYDLELDIAHYVSTFLAPSTTRRLANVGA